MGIWTWVIIGAVVLFVVLLCVALAIASFSFENYYAKLQEVDEIQNSARMTTLEYVSQINQSNFGGRLHIERCEQFYDHYSTGRVALSDNTMNSDSLASFAIVSHELGHARQDTGDTLKKHWRLRRLGRICGLFFMPLLIVGAICSVLWVFEVLPQLVVIIVGGSLIAASFLIFLFAIILRYKEVQIEKQASVFALDFLREVLNESEVKVCQELLNRARLTYWAGLIRTMLSWTMLTPKENLFK